VTNIGGQTIQLDVGYWRICGWLIDDSMGAVVWQASSIVHVLAFSGSLSIAIDRHPRGFQFTLTYASSSPGRVYASLQRASRPCPRNPDRISKKSILLVPRAGRFVASDGGLGRAISAKRLSPGRWRVCSWLRADEGAVGPASRTFAVRRRRVAHAAG
jgi:hypothetical protein